MKNKVFYTRDVNDIIHLKFDHEIMRIDLSHSADTTAFTNQKNENSYTKNVSFWSVKELQYCVKFTSQILLTKCPPSQFKKQFCLSVLSLNYSYVPSSLNSLLYM